jgi:peptidoglycan/LPS O-acetylase OafA/YrhL
MADAPPQQRQAGDPRNPGGFAHIPALDGVRGVAILFVLCVHLFSSNTEGNGKLFRILGRITASGYIGVNLFFVLSGFLITGILLDTLNQPAYFKTFYARRILRIFPLYYGVLLLLLLLTHPLHLNWGGWGPLLFTYTSNLAFWRANQLIPLHPFNINHFWTLQVEEQFYFVWPFLVYRLQNARRIIPLALAGCGVVFLIRLSLVLYRARFQNIYLPYSTTFACADNLLYGCCLAALMRTSARELALRIAPFVFAAGSLLILCMGIIFRGLQWQNNITVPTLGFSIIAITFAALIAMTLQERSRTQRAFSNSVLRFFGRYSYGIYVFHYSVAEIVGLPVRRWANLHFHSKAFAVLSGAAAVVCVSIALALISYHLYEKRFLRLKRYFTYGSRSISNQLAA